MKYEFVCSKCNNHQTITMKMSDYTENGHYCDKCNTELKRTIDSLVCGMSIDKTGTFYRSVN